MPAPELILQGLTYAASRFEFLSIFWHIVFLLLLVMIAAGRRPNDRAIAMILVLPLTTVALVAFRTQNPFNGIVFSLASLLLYFLGWRITTAKCRITWDFLSIFGVLMILFGWIYPHFLPDPGWLRYLYATPLGVVPCPTLSLVIGFTLLFHGFGSKAWMLTLGIFGLFYATVGIFRLGVILDTGLLAGVMVLLVYGIRFKKITEA